MCVGWLLGRRWRHDQERPGAWHAHDPKVFKKGTNWFDVMAQDDVTVYPLEDVAKSGDRSTALQADTKAATTRCSGMEARHQVHARAYGSPMPRLSSSGLRLTATGMRIQGCTRESTVHSATRWLQNEGLEFVGAN
jgi:hypothetical protein